MCAFKFEYPTPTYSLYDEVFIGDCSDKQKIIGIVCVEENKYRSVYYQFDDGRLVPEKNVTSVDDRFIFLENKEIIARVNYESYLRAKIEALKKLGDNYFTKENFPEALGTIEKWEEHFVETDTLKFVWTESCWGWGVIYKSTINRCMIEQYLHEIILDTQYALNYGMEIKV